MYQTEGNNIPSSPDDASSSRTIERGYVSFYYNSISWPYAIPCLPKYPRRLEWVVLQNLPKPWSLPWELSHPKKLFPYSEYGIL